MYYNVFFFLTFQQRLKEEREAKRAQLDGRHDYVLSIVASCVALEKAEVEDTILEGNQVRGTTEENRSVTVGPPTPTLEPLLQF